MFSGTIKRDKMATVSQFFKLPKPLLAWNPSRLKVKPWREELCVESFYLSYRLPLLGKVRQMYMPFKKWRKPQAWWDQKWTPLSNCLVKLVEIIKHLWASFQTTNLMYSIKLIDKAKMKAAPPAVDKCSLCPFRFLISMRLINRGLFFTMQFQRIKLSHRI